MPEKLNSAFPRLPRVAQENSYYCGPATVEMLLGNLGIEVSQGQIVEAVTTPKKVQLHGITIEELGEAVAKLNEQLDFGVVFWFKKHATITELAKAINEHKHPVGVEWQGKFDYPDEEIADDEDDDPGHIAVITRISTRENVVFIADPDRHYAKKDRFFTVLEFERRWWDINTIIDSKTRKTKEVDDFHVMFIITSKRETWPEGLGMKRWE